MVAKVGIFTVTDSSYGNTFILLVIFALIRDKITTISDDNSLAIVCITIKCHTRLFTSYVSHIVFMEMEITELANSAIIAGLHLVIRFLCAIFDGRVASSFI